MGMNMGGSGGGRRRGHKSVMAEINVTPMVDVMLVLLIIFMVSAPLLTVGVPLFFLTREFTDAAGQPVMGTLIEVWQANAAGRYIHPNDDDHAPVDANFYGAARLVTDDASTPARMPANAGDAFWACATWAGSAASKAASRSDGLRVSRAS